MPNGPLYNGIGTSAGTAVIDGRETEVIGLLLPAISETGQPVDEDGDEIYMTLPAAKALLIDLKACINASEKVLLERKRRRPKR